jgi:hypothetical protein
LIEKLHEHITDELRTNARTDTVFSLSSILLNFIALAINWSVTVENDAMESSAIVVFVIFTVLVLVVNTVAVLGMLRGRQTREKLLGGLLKMYKDQHVEGYYDPSILAAYNQRYLLFIIAVAATGFVAIAVPAVMMAL